MAEKRNDREKGITGEKLMTKKRDREEEKLGECDNELICFFDGIKALFYAFIV